MHWKMHLLLHFQLPHSLSKLLPNSTKMIWGLGSLSTIHAPQIIPHLLERWRDTYNSPFFAASEWVRTWERIGNKSVHAWGGSVNSLKKNTELLEGPTLWSPPAVVNRRPLGWTSSEKVWSPACHNHIGFSTIILGVPLPGGGKGWGAAPQLWQSFCFCQMMGLANLNPPFLFSL
jgi:hypothetical protein